MAVWAASLPGGELEAFHLRRCPRPTTGGRYGGMPELDDADAAIMLVDPYTFPVEALLDQLAQ